MVHEQIERDLVRRDSTFVADQSPAVVFVGCLYDVALSLSLSPFRCKEGCKGSEGNNVSLRFSREQSRFSWLVVSSFEGNFVFGGVSLMDRIFARTRCHASSLSRQRWLDGVFIRVTGNLAIRNRGR